jgi:TPR repeat protein
LPAAPAASPSVQHQQAKANEPTPQSESTFATVPAAPPSQPSQAASDQAGAAPFSGPQSAPAQGSSTAMRPDAEEIAALVNRGSDFLKKGDYTSARLLLRRAAAAGSASAAFMLGATFDPLVIQQIGGIGIKPDIALARQWYEKAAELGSDAALQQLAKLAQTGK